MSASQTTSTTIEADVLAAQQGDQQAFTRLVEATCRLVTSIALTIVRDFDLSRDVAQDVFLSAWRDIRKLRSPSSFVPWIRQIAFTESNVGGYLNVMSAGHTTGGRAKLPLKPVSDSSPIPPIGLQVPNRSSGGGTNVTRSSPNGTGSAVNVNGWSGRLTD
jgi:hypothetical protein